MKKILLLLPLLISVNCWSTDVPESSEELKTRLISCFQSDNEAASADNLTAVEELIYHTTAGLVEQNKASLCQALIDEEDDVSRRKFIGDIIREYGPFANAGRVEIAETGILIPNTFRDLGVLVLHNLRGTALWSKRSVCKEWQRYIDQAILKSPHMRCLYVDKSIGLHESMTDYGWDETIHKVSLNTWGIQRLCTSTPVMLYLDRSCTPLQIQHVLPGLCSSLNVRVLVWDGARNRNRFHLPAYNQGPDKTTLALRTATEVIPYCESFLLRRSSSMFPVELCHEIEFLRNTNQSILSELFGFPLFRILFLKKEKGFRLPSIKVGPMSYIHPKRQEITSWLVRVLKSNDQHSRTFIANIMPVLSSFNSAQGFVDLFQRVNALFVPEISNEFEGEELAKLQAERGRKMHKHIKVLECLAVDDAFKDLLDEEKVLVLDFLKEMNIDEIDVQSIPEVLLRYHTLKGKFDQLENSTGVVRTFARFSVHAASSEEELEFADELAQICSGEYVGLPSLVEALSDIENTEYRTKIVNTLRIHNTFMSLDNAYKTMVLGVLRKFKDKELFLNLLPHFAAVIDEGLSGPELIKMVYAINYSSKIYDQDHVASYIDLARFLVAYESQVDYALPHVGGPKFPAFLRNFFATLSAMYNGLNDCFDQQTPETRAAVERFLIKFTTEKLNSTTGFLYTQLKAKGDDAAKLAFLKRMVETNPSNVVAALFAK